MSENEKEPAVTVGTIIEGKTVAEVGKMYDRKEKTPVLIHDIPVKFTDGTCGVVIVNNYRSPPKLSLRTLRSPIGRKLLERSAVVPTVWHHKNHLSILVEAPKSETEEGFSETVRIEYPWLQDFDDNSQHPDIICRFAKPDRW